MEYVIRKVAMPLDTLNSTIFLPDGAIILGIETEEYRGRQVDFAVEHWEKIRYIIYLMPKEM